MSESAKAVFLSYASQDAEAARGLCDALRGAGIEVWFDETELRGGDAWDASIRRQVKECALFVALISAHTEARSEGYFRREWNLAVSRMLDIADDRAFLLPIVIDDTAEATARVPERFRERQWTRLAGAKATPEFVARVRRLLDVPIDVRGDSKSDGATLGATRAAIATPDRSSIAVIPFVDLSQEGDNEYFADGLAEEMLNVLAKIRGLRVAARSSAFTFKGKGVTVAEVGRALNVATVLEGSVRKAGNRLRIAVQLVNAADGYHLWSETYDRTLEDIFAVQDDIAQSVVKELRGTLLGRAVDAKAAAEATAQVADAVQGRATDAEAHRLFLQGRYLNDRITRDDTTKAIGYLKQAVERNPGFALAWVELSRSYSTEVELGAAMPAEAFRRAREAVARALTLAPSLPEGHAQLGLIQMYEWDWRGAEASLRRALELAPGNAFVLHRFSILTLMRGRPDEAITLIRRALEQDPLTAGAYMNLGTMLNAAGRLAEAEAAYRKAAELAPQIPNTATCLAINLVAQGRLDEALAAARQELDVRGRLHALTVVYSASGRRAEADAALRELIARHAEYSAYMVAQLYALRGEPDLAFESLERAYVQRDHGLGELKFEPQLRPLHADPRWGAFLRKMGFAD